MECWTDMQNAGTWHFIWWCDCFTNKPSLWAFKLEWSRRRNWKGDKGRNISKLKENVLKIGLNILQENCLQWNYFQDVPILLVQFEQEKCIYSSTFDLPGETGLTKEIYKILTSLSFNVNAKLTLLIPSLPLLNGLFSWNYYSCCKNIGQASQAV